MALGSENLKKQFPVISITLKVVSGAILFTFVAYTAFSGQMKFVEDAKKGTLTVREGQFDVLTYCYGDQLKKGVHPKYTRSCYIHPLFSLDGQVLTEDFPGDHLHHHGVFWTWPVVKTRGKDTQTWHPANPSLRQHFVRWLKREVEEDVAVLSVENVWKLDEEEVVAGEVVTLRIHPADDIGRAIDVQLVFQGVGGPLELQGESDQKKGYGGLCLRGAPLFKGARLTTNQGVQKKDSTNLPYIWADLSTSKLGVAIFVSPDHRGFPIAWLIRNSYAGILNPSWPGIFPVVLQPEVPVTLRYRLYIHRGDVDSGKVSEAYDTYLSEKQQAKQESKG